MSAIRGLLRLGVIVGVWSGTAAVGEPHWAFAEPPEPTPTAGVQSSAPAPKPKLDQKTDQKLDRPVTTRPAPPGAVPARTEQQVRAQRSKTESAAPAEGDPVAQQKLETATARPLVEATAAALPSASPWPREPSLYETGRVGQMGVSASGVRINQTPDATKPKELRIEEKAINPEGPNGSPGPGGTLSTAVFGRELRPRFALLKDCRIEVARQRRTDTASVAAGGLTLRWTVLPSGSVADTQVVAMSPVDGRVVDCVKRQMSLWSFSPPVGGPVRVERTFKFQ